MCELDLVGPTLAAVSGDLADHQHHDGVVGQALAKHAEEVLDGAAESLEGAGTGGRLVDRTWIRNLYGFAIAPHLVFYLKIDEKTLIRRVLQARGMDYWESGMDMKLGDDIYESFRAYQKALLKEYTSMSDEFGFRVLDARRKVDVIQDELRRQIGAFLAESDSTRAETAPAGTSTP